jgi:hypothetical protein
MFLADNFRWCSVFSSTHCVFIKTDFCIKLSSSSLVRISVGNPPCLEETLMHSSSTSQPSCFKSGEFHIFYNDWLRMCISISTACTTHESSISPCHHHNHHSWYFYKVWPSWYSLVMTHNLLSLTKRFWSTWHHSHRKHLLLLYAWMIKKCHWFVIKFLVLI